jgi:putative oxidoreductase
MVMFHSQAYQDGVALLARVLLAALFINAGYHKIVEFDAVVDSIMGRGIPLPQIATVVVILTELVGGLMVLVGFQARWAAFGIMLLIIPINYFYHPFWADDGQLSAFLKNASVMGGMLFVTVHGPGRLALQRD